MNMHSLYASKFNDIEMMSYVNDDGRQDHKLLIHKSLFYTLLCIKSESHFSVALAET